MGNFDLTNLWAGPKSSDSSCKKGLRLATDLRHHAAGLSTARYRVDRAMPKRAAISTTGISAVLSRVRMVLVSLGESFAGQPPLRPRARADLRPATVLSRIKLRSNSARAAKTWNTRRPAGERVSIFSVREVKTIRALLKTADIPVAEIATRFGIARSTLYRSLLKTAV